MRVAVSVINMKGGVGKTTIATLLCRGLAQSLKVLAIDLDPQANMSQALMGEAGYRRFLDDRSPSVVEVFKGYQPPGSAPSPTPLEATEVARAVERGRNGELRLVPSRFDFSDNLRDASRADDQALARFIADSFNDIDIVLIDCAPTESVLISRELPITRHGTFSFRFAQSILPRSGFRCCIDRWRIFGGAILVTRLMCSAS